MLTASAFNFGGYTPAAMAQSNLSPWLGSMDATGSLSVGDLSGFGNLAPVNNGPVVTMNQGAGGVLGSGMNGFQVANAAMSGLQTIGNLWNSYQAMKLAKQQFKLTKNVTNTNLANQIQTYNTAIADRARSRGVMEGQSQGQVEGYINANSLSRSSGRNGPTPTSTISAAALSNYGSYVDPNRRP